MDKKIMILGASALQVPAIKKAKEMGYKIILVDYDEDAVGFPLADVKLVVSTLDQEEVYRQALIYHPDVVITSTSDGPVRTAAYVNEKLGKKPDLSYEDSLCATIKSYMRNRLKENGVPVPEYYAATDYEGFRDAVCRLNGYCIVKPADNAGSRGVQLVDMREHMVQFVKSPSDDETENKSVSESGKRQFNDEVEDKLKMEIGHETESGQGIDLESELKNIYEYSVGNSRNGTVMVEEFMDGAEVSVEAMTVDGETRIITITDKYITPPPYFVELAHCEPSMLDEGVKAQIEQVALQAVRAIGLQNGPSHTEIKVTKDGPKVVELAARLGGDFITSRLVPLSTGIDMVGVSVELAVGEKADIAPKWNRGAAIHFIQAKEGVIKEIAVPDEVYRLKGVEEVAIYKKAGDRVHGTKSSNDRLGHVITSGKMPSEAMEAGKRALGMIVVEYEIKT